MPESEKENERRVRSLRAEIDTAAAMMLLARYAHEPILVLKYQQVAVHSFLAAMDLLVIGVLQPGQENAAWDQLAPIRQWLERERLINCDRERPQ
jgi:hypothetical protein